MIENRDLDFGFVILSADRDMGRIKSTLRSINLYYEGIPAVCIVPKATKAVEMSELKTLCPTFRGKKTFTSLINTGLKKGCKKWNYIVMEGAILRRGLVQRYAHFITSEDDVLFPIAVDYDSQGRPLNLHTEFHNCTLNGLFMHQQAIKKVGDFGDEPLEMARILWATYAMPMGIQFKAILGTKLN